MLKQYQAYLRNKRISIVILGSLLLGLVLLSASLGSIKINFKDVVWALLRFDRGGVGRIIWDVRLPRICAAVLVGASLALAGTVMQAILANPLASPYTLGLSSAAAFGAALAIVCFNAGTASRTSLIINNSFIVVVSAFFFACLSTLAILLLAVLTKVSAESLVLSGIAIGALCSAGLMLLEYLADSIQLASIVSWTFGDLGRANWHNLALTTASWLPLFLVFLSQRWTLNALSSGDETAKGLGVNTGLVRIIMMLAASLLSAVAVALFGTIAFIGLLGPHIGRRVFGDDQRFLLIAAPLFGAIILLAADTMARTIFSPVVLPVGILTSLSGGPLFIYLLLRDRQG